MNASWWWLTGLGKSDVLIVTVTVSVAVLLTLLEVGGRGPAHLTSVHTAHPPTCSVT